MLSVCILTVACDVSDVRRLAAAARHRLQSEYDIFDGSLSAVPAASGGALNPSSRYLYVSVDRTSTPHVLCDVIDAEVRKNCVQHPALCNATVCGSSFTLAPTDTLTWLGCTPPPALYFSWQSYVFLRLRPRAYVPWAEYGDAINHLILNASGASSPWSSTTLVVTGADANSLEDARLAFVQAGVDSRAVNLDVLNASVINLRRPLPAIVDRPDFLQTFVRVAQPASRPALDEYLNTSWPVLLLRRKAEAARPFVQHGVPPLRPLKTGVDEAAFARPLAALKQAALAHFASTTGHVPVSAQVVTQYHRDAVADNDDLRCLQDASFSPEPLPLDPNATSNRTGCAAATRDCLYTGAAAHEDATLSSGSAVLLVGVNHGRTGKAAYSNMMLSAYVGSKFTDHKYSVTVGDAQMHGSAQRFVPAMPAAVAASLYAVTLARNCSELDVTTCVEVAESVIGPSERLAVLGRNYLEPRSAVHPDYDEIEPAHFLVLRRTASGGLSAPPRGGRSVSPSAPPPDARTVHRHRESEGLIDLKARVKAT